MSSHGALLLAPSTGQVSVTLSNEVEGLVNASVSIFGVEWFIICGVGAFRRDVFISSGEQV